MVLLFNFKIMTREEKLDDLLSRIESKSDVLHQNADSANSDMIIDFCNEVEEIIEEYKLLHI